MQGEQVSNVQAVLRRLQPSLTARVTLFLKPIEPPSVLRASIHSGADESSHQRNLVSTQCRAFRLKERCDEERVAIEFNASNLAGLVFRINS